MNYILFDDYSRNNLLPLTFTRPVCDIRFGILTIREKWEKTMGIVTSTLTEEYLSERFPIVKGAHNILINGSVSPTPQLIEEIKALQPNEAIVGADTIIALHVIAEDLDKIGEGDTEGIVEKQTNSEVLKITYPWDLVVHNNAAISHDFRLLTAGRASAPIPAHVRATSPENIFIEKGARIENVHLNASDGPIYIGENVHLMDGAKLRGAIALCDSAIVKMGTNIYGATTIGPHVKVGGEIENSILLAYSNKPHHGYLGHSVIGKWCNLAAGTTVANLNNTYRNIRAWNYTQERFIDTGMQFLGLIMGDHSKTGINTMFNTGTVVGVNSNVFGAGYQRNFVPSFVWGGPTGFDSYDINKALEVASYVYKRRGLDFDQTEKNLLTNVYNITFNNIRL
ncbi:MAG: putative sugar nucleotidyl transferase [Bacteroidales bacterium]|nr:putative sugar nucleotidyl transferase [Bacteroidales bacterium]MDD3664655.1 putative sugar nucleotidyl transferase [Bacteroidales bacterium]